MTAAPNTSCCACLAPNMQRSTYPGPNFKVCECECHTAHQSSQSKGWTDILAKEEAKQGESWAAEFDALVEQMFVDRFVTDTRLFKWGGKKEFTTHIKACIAKLLSERKEAEIKITGDAIEMSKAGWLAAGATAERERILAALDKLGNEVGLKPHFPGGALEKKKQQQLEIISKMMALLSPNQTTE